MMDREMLELAARAVGIKLEWNDKGESGYWEDWRGLPNWEPWNPRDYDGDALRLAVQLRMEIDCYYGEVASGEEGERNQTLIVDNYRDPYAATRRAIVRAAAEIGRQMEVTK